MKQLLLSALIFANITAYPLFSEEKPKLSDYRYNVYSQFGEDGIIAKIFETIGTTNKIAVEFGAHDGFECSNTANLWYKDSTWVGVLIEGISNRFKVLQNNLATQKNTVLIEAFIEIEGKNSIESILSQHNIPTTLDLMSIDIDGSDYYIFNSLTNYRPRVIICEYNPTMPSELDIYPDPVNYIGASPAALIRIGKLKGYTLIAMTHCNCIFVVDEELSHFVDYEISLGKIKLNECVRYLITDYLGNYLMIGEDKTTPGFGVQRKSNEQVHGNVKHLPLF